MGNTVLHSQRRNLANDGVVLRIVDGLPVGVYFKSPFPDNDDTTAIGQFFSLGGPYADLSKFPAGLDLGVHDDDESAFAIGEKLTLDSQIQTRGVKPYSRYFDRVLEVDKVLVPVSSDDLDGQWYFKIQSGVAGQFITYLAHNPDGAYVATSDQELVVQVIKDDAGTVIGGTLFTPVAAGSDRWVAYPGVVNS